MPLNKNAKQRALQSSGCEIRFRLSGPSVKISVGSCETGAPQHGGGLAQVLFGDYSYTYFPVDETTRELEVTAPTYESLEKASGAEGNFHPRLVRLILPTHAAIHELSIEGDVCAPEPEDCPEKRLLIYGSSITQGAGSITSREDWASRCAHLLGFDLINLGFGGGCHCENEMTDYLCQRDDFDCVILETGINMLGMEPEIADRRIENLIRQVSKTHSEKPIFCLGVFPCSEDILNPTTGRAEAIRKLVRKTVDEIDSPNLHFIDGKHVMDYRKGMTVDLVHPSPAGMIDIGTQVAKEVDKRLR